MLTSPPNGGRWRLALLVAALLLGAAPASGVSELRLITTGPETVKSQVQPTNGHKASFPTPSSYEQVETDLGAGSISILDFFLPTSFDSFGMNFALTRVPITLSGSIQMLPGNTHAAITFPGVQLGFVRDGYAGDLILDLSTWGAVVPAGCGGRPQDQMIAGSHLDLVTGSIELVGAVCPQQGWRGDPAQTEIFDDAFRIFLRGTLTNPPAPVPEPGTLLLLAGGLLGLGQAGRRRRGTRSRAHLERSGTRPVL